MKKNQYVIITMVFTLILIAFSSVTYAESNQKNELLKENKTSTALNNMKQNKDEMRELIFYTDKSTPWDSRRNGFDAYIVATKEDKPELRLEICYESNANWLFIRNYIIKADDQIFKIPISSPKLINRDNANGWIWEWYDTPVNADTYQIIKAVIASNKTVIRCVGDQYYDEITVSKRWKIALQNVLDAYDALGGTYNFSENIQ